MSDIVDDANAALAVAFDAQEARIDLAAAALIQWVDRAWQEGDTYVEVVEVALLALRRRVEQRVGEPLPFHMVRTERWS